MKKANPKGVRSKTKSKQRKKEAEAQRRWRLEEREGQILERVWRLEAQILERQFMRDLEAEVSDLVDHYFPNGLPKGFFNRRMSASQISGH